MNVLKNLEYKEERIVDGRLEILIGLQFEEVVGGINAPSALVTIEDGKEINIKLLEGNNSNYEWEFTPKEKREIINFVLKNREGKTKSFQSKKKRNDEFGDRMKGYENAYRIKLPKRLPVMIRIDGKAFHTYTRGMEKPFDEVLTNAFWETCKYLASEVIGCKVVYHQSDEITLLLTNYDQLKTESWFDNNLQKMASIAASLATAKFNEVMRVTHPEKQLALFDARVWVLPQEEVNNAFLWRQQDASKNSISMVAQAHFSQKTLNQLNGAEMKEKLLVEKGVDWNNLPVWQKRGVCIKKEYFEKNGAMRSKWEVDHNTPIFSEETDYINQYVYAEKEKYSVHKILKAAIELIKGGMGAEEVQRRFKLSKDDMYLIDFFMNEIE